MCFMTMCMTSCASTPVHSSWVISSTNDGDHKIDVPSVHMVGMVGSGATFTDRHTDPKNGCRTTNCVTARDIFICASIVSLQKVQVN